MICNELLVIIAPETLMHMSAIFSACPFDMDLHQAYLSLNISPDEMTPEPENVYSAQAGNLGIWYDQSTGYSSLILPVVSPAINERVAQVREKAPNIFYGAHYFPFITLVEDFPPISRRYSGFISSVSNSLATLPVPLFFDAELVRTREFNAVPYADYYAAQVANKEAQRG
jgi:hypothetical protein